MTLTSADIVRAAGEAGFQMEPFEKIVQLVGLLEAIRSHPFLKKRVVLKGGTALNLFASDLPRLSVDIDLNYIGAVDRKIMLEDRPKTEQALRAVCGRLGIQIRRSPTEHAGGKWRLSYLSVLGRTSTLELDVNFMLRTPLWPPQTGDSRAIGSWRAVGVPLLDIHELAAGKMAALMARSAGRDLFDVRELLERKDLDRAKLRLGFVVYGGINRKDWRKVSVDDIEADPLEIDRRLVPLLRSDRVPAREEIDLWAKQLVTDCRSLMSAVLPLAANELEFLERLNGRGEMIPELLTPDEGMQALLRTNPGLKWKALNVRKHRIR